MRIQLKFFALISILWAISCSLVGAGSTSELTLKGIHFYGFYKGDNENAVYYVDDKEIIVPKGETLRQEFNKLYGGEHISIQLMDVELEVANIGRKKINKVEVNLIVTPKVATIKYLKSPSNAIDEQLTEAGAKWSGPILRQLGTITGIEPFSSEKIIFEGIDLQAIIKKHFKKNTWPIELCFAFSVESSDKQEGTLSRVLQIPLPPY